MIKIVLGTPKQNDMAERMNKTLHERAICMRIQLGLHKVFCADAISTTTYLINREPSVPLDYQLPEEVWFGNEVDLSHMKVLGYASYILLDSNSRDKLNPRAKKCYFN